MGVRKTEAEMKSLLSETIVAWCRDCLSHHAEVCVEGLLGITLNSNEIFLVSINQTINNNTGQEVTVDVDSVDVDSEDAGSKVLDLSEEKMKSESEDETESIKSTSDKSVSKKRRIRKQKRKALDPQATSPSVSLTNENSPPSDDEEVIDETKNAPPPKSARVKSLRSRAKKACPYSKKFKPRVQAYETQSQLVMVKEETMSPMSPTALSPAGYQGFYHPTTPYLQDQVNQSTAILPASSSHNGANTAVVSYNSPNTVALPGSSEMIPAFEPGQMQNASGGHIFRNLWPPERAEQAEVKSNEKTCHFCGREFERPFNLKQHLLVHTGVKPFLCTLCGQTFTRKGNLKAHIQHQHSN